jgi:hypothetical protein
MKQTLFFLTALAVIFLATCGGQKPAAAVKADTTAACCDSATLAKCRADSTGVGCGDCVIPAAPVETASGKAAPAQCTS